MKHRLYLIVLFPAIISLSSCVNNIVKTVLYITISPFVSSNNETISHRESTSHHEMLYFIAKVYGSHNLYSRSMEGVYQGASNTSQPHYAIPNYLDEVRENISPEELRKLFDKNGRRSYELISNIKLPKEFIAALQMTHSGYYYTIEKYSKQEFLRRKNISEKEIKFPELSITVAADSPIDIIKDISVPKGAYNFYIIKRHTLAKRDGINTQSNTSNLQLRSTMLSPSHRDEILRCIQCDRFVLYSLNLGDSEINQVINKNKHKELRKLIYKGVSTGTVTALAEQDIERKEESALRIQLLPQTYDGKNIELIFPQFKSKKIYSISINVEILEEIKKSYCRVRSC